MPPAGKAINSAVAGQPIISKKKPEIRFFLAAREAGAAVNRFAGSGLKGHLCFGAAFGTDSRVHFPGASGTFPAPARTAVGAPARLIGKALLGVKFLFACGEDKFCSTITALQGLVGKFHGK
jgi:hypothetical protein